MTENEQSKENDALEQRLISRLNELGISTTIYRHPPLRTVEDSKEFRGEFIGTHIKNLFLRDKKRNLYLVTIEEDRQVDLKTLRKHLTTQGNLSFGSAELLWEALGVRPGAVTPLAVINDGEGNVQMIVEQSMVDREVINAHPLHNEATVAIACDDFLRFLEACDHTPQLVDLGDP